MRLIPTSDGGRIDDRAVSEVLGAILIFALVLALVVIIQVSAVPAMNQQIEYSHNQRVQGDMQLLGEHVDYTAGTGVETSTTIEMGVYYPTRIFLLNPPPASASLTTKPTTMTLRNVQADGETRDYWNGEPKPFTSRRLTYTPDYNEYASAPNTVYEGWTLYNEHPTGTDLALDRTSPITDNRIRLVALDGRRAETSTSPVMVTAEPLSVPEQTVSVHDDGQPIVLTLETNLSETAWEQTLADEICTDADNNDICDSPTPGGHIVDWNVTGGTLTVVLEKDQTYELRMTEVGIGSQTTRESPHYMTAIDPPQVINPGGSEFTVEVRDQFNTARSGVDVTWRVESGSARLSSTTATTDEDGQATVRAVPTANESLTLVAEADLNGDATIQERERVRFSNLPLSDQPDDQDPSDINPNYENGVLLERAVIGDSGAYADVTWRNTGTAESRTVAAMRINFYSVDGQGRASTYEVTSGHVSDVGDTTSVTLPLRGPYQPNMQLDDISPGQTETYRFRFTAFNRKQSKLEPFSISDGDFFIVSIKFDDGTTARYFIDPRSPVSGGGA